MTVLKDKQVTRSFRILELRCKCLRPLCDAVPMTKEVMIKAQELRDLYGKALRVHSAARCEYWNTKVGGAVDSQHLHGNALDLAPYDADDIPLLAQMGEKIGFHGIGVSRLFVHVDMGPPGRRWTYP